MPVERRIVEQMCPTGDSLDVMSISHSASGPYHTEGLLFRLRTLQLPKKRARPDRSRQQARSQSIALPIAACDCAMISYSIDVQTEHLRTIERSDAQCTGGYAKNQTLAYYSFKVPGKVEGFHCSRPVLCEICRDILFYCSPCVFMTTAIYFSTSVGELEGGECIPCCPPPSRGLWTVKLLIPLQSRTFSGGPYSSGDVVIA